MLSCYLTAVTAGQGRELSTKSSFACLIVLHTISTDLILEQHQHMSMSGVLKATGGWGIREEVSEDLTPHKM